MTFMESPFSFFKHHISKNTAVIIGFLVGAVILAGGGFYAGYARGTEYPKTILVKGITNIGDEDVTADFGLFWEAWDLLKTTHISGNQIADQNLVYGAIEGLTNSFGDPNTNFFRPDDSKKFEEDINGSFGGIGAEIGLKDNELIIVAPLKGSPSEKAGLLSGDKIIKIGDTVTTGMSVNDAVKKIRGPIGSVVTLHVLRNGWENSKSFKITRDTIMVPTIDSKLMDNGIMYINIHSFNENAAFDFTDPAVEALTKNAKGMILDLRNNPGGFLEVAIHLAGWFVEKGEVVVTEEFRIDPPRIFKASGNEALISMPVVILMNEGSASASEILAGALRDIRGIQIVGAQSFGKGTVQELHGLKDGSKLKITVAHWLTPKGIIIEKNGLTPDYVVELTEQDIAERKDRQLEKAIEVLQSEITKAVTGN
jgi:carboxyl-terminal processing protease